MKPIVSPWFFYLIGVSEGLSTLFMLIAIFATIVGFAACAIRTFAAETEEEEKLCNPWCKLLYLGIICSVLFCIIPSKETSYQMMAATIVTPDNLKIATDTTVDVANWIVDSVDKIIENEASNE